MSSSKALGSLVILMSAVFAVAADAQQPPTTIVACVRRDDSVRIISARERCRSSERRIEWNVQGPKGATGAMGPAGAPGTPGAKGATGARGQDGAQGLPGIQGPQGPTGAQGPRGETGKPGIDGAAGPAGIAGPAGPTGPKGDTGAAGNGAPIVPAGNPSDVVAYASNLAIDFGNAPGSGKGRFGISGLEWTGSTDQGAGSLKPFIIASTDPQTAAELRTWFADPEQRALAIELLEIGKGTLLRVEMPVCAPAALTSSFIGAGVEMRVQCLPNQMRVTALETPADPLLADTTMLDADLEVTDGMALQAGSYGLAASAASGGGQRIIWGGINGNPMAHFIPEPVHLRLTPAPRLNGKKPHHAALMALLGGSLGYAPQHFNLTLYAPGAPKTELAGEFDLAQISGGVLMNPFLLRHNAEGDPVLPVVIDVDISYRQRLR